MTEKENFQEELSTLVAKYKGKGISEQEIREILIQVANINNPIIDRLRNFQTQGNKINTNLNLNNYESKKKDFDDWYSKMLSFITVSLSSEKKAFEDSYPNTLYFSTRSHQQKATDVKEEIEAYLRFLDEEIKKQENS